MRYDSSITDISNGNLYRSGEMVRVGCHDCAGCSDCCRQMGDTVLVDPYDVNRLCKALGKSFSDLLIREVELHVEDGLILPNLKMDEEQKCVFLNENGRCSIHAHRPGICRLFPLGRQYEENSLSYFVLENACPAGGKTKIKIEKWMDTPQMKKYEQFLVDWHNLTKRLRAELSENADEVYQKQVSSMFVQLFFQKPYGDDFYNEFYERCSLIM